MDFGTTAEMGAVTLFDGSSSTGAITAVFEDFDAGDAVAAANTAKTIKTGAGQTQSISAQWKLRMLEQ